MTAIEVNSEQRRSFDPSLSGSDTGSQRYPNQFFDLSQQYMPPTIKELFKWCTFYFYNSPLIGAALKKMSRYPITDIIIEDTHESKRDLWETVFNKTLKIKDRLLEVNLDAHVYGNCFVSLHLPTTRMLKCKKCAHSAVIKQWNWAYRGNSFMGVCSACQTDGALDVKDVVYKDLKGIKLIRWNPENMEIKYNEYTGRHTYLYTVPRRVRMAVQEGDKDIIEDLPLTVLDAIHENKKIKVNPDNLKHLKNPTLAEQDQGWGKPVIIHVLKDMFYFYTLRRAQEAIALEHIVPFDIIYPMPNAQMDPYVHSDLGDWKTKIEGIIKKHRKDPNYKAIIPIPVGFGRLGGDGRALLLGPELNYVTQTVVGGLGIPQEFLFGGLNFTGSSITLRTLENDFIQNRSQLIDLVYWIKDKVRVWLNCPDVEGIKFSDFRMADDIQKNQQLIGLNAQGKVSDQTMLTELGYNFEEEVKKRLEEIHIQNFMNDLLARGQARSQGESQIIGFNFQQKLQELSEKAQNVAQEKVQAAFKHDATGQIAAMVDKLMKMQPEKAEATLAQLKAQVPEVASAIESGYKSLRASQEMQIQQQQQQQQGMLQEQQQQQQTAEQQQQQQISQAQVGAYGEALKANMLPDKQGGTDMRPAPNQKPPRRKGGI